jgi:hypothetical protein
MNRNPKLLRRVWALALAIGLLGATAAVLAPRRAMSQRPNQMLGCYWVWVGDHYVCGHSDCSTAPPGVQCCSYCTPV